jgi:uncharacterized RDD family membrane protein YckC
MLPAWMVDAVVAPLVRPVVDAVDVDDVVDRIDVDELIERIDVNALVDRIDPNALLDRIDPNALLDRIDPNALLDRVDLDQLLDRVDVNRLLDRVDVNRLLDRVEVDQLLHRLDPNPLVDRVDVNGVMQRVDVNGLVQRTELGEIIARSTTGVFGQVVDVARTGTMAVDVAIQGVSAQILFRPEPWGQRSPRTPGAITAVRSLPPSDRAVALQGHYAGSFSRFVAFLIDSAVSAALFAAGVAITVLALDVVAGVSLEADDHRVLVGVAAVVWQFLYLAVPTGLTGRTVGKAALGLLVVAADGSPVSGRRAAVRTLAFPISFLLFGAGLLLGLVRLDRRQLHDLFGRTAVVYAWDAEVARLRTAARHDADVAARPPGEFRELRPAGGPDHPPGPTRPPSLFERPPSETR